MTSRLQLDLTQESLQELEQLRDELEMSTKKELFNTAIGLLMWAMKERKSGRLIASVDPQLESYKELLIPALERLARRHAKTVTKTRGNARPPSSATSKRAAGIHRTSGDLQAP